MGKNLFTRAAYTSAKASAGVGERGVTARAEAQARRTGKLEPLVDPSGFGVIRLSLPRVEKRDDGLYEMLVGCPLPIETRVDTTGSMGDNVDIAMKVLPDAFESYSKVTEGYDIQVATGIFGDVGDNFVLCRPQFEMDATKIVNQLTLMVPERAGGDFPEDPDLGIFGAAYLCRHYINRIGLKGYDFTATDAPGRGIIAPEQLERVYGEKVWEKIAENGFQLRKGQFQLADVWEALLDRAHAFVLQVGDNGETKRFWTDIVGKDRLIALPHTKFMPHVQAAIIGLTEGTLVLNDVPGFLEQFNIKSPMIEKIAESVSNVPVGAQQQLPGYENRPQKGDLFEGKPDVWEDQYLLAEGKAVESEESSEEEDDWL